MAKRNRSTTEKTLDKRVRAGRGQGHGAAYKPWLLVQDVASQGLAHRVKGWTTERVHHLLSNLERDYFYVLDWSEEVCDIREQYPLLPLEETQALAERCGVRHPTDPQTKQPVVMTSDFVIDVVRNKQCVQQARAVKPSAMLNKQRVLEKLEVERLYWQARGVDWGIVTEQEIPAVFAGNIHKLHSYRQIVERIPTQANFDAIVKALSVAATSKGITLKVITQNCDAALGLPDGTSLTIVYHLVATHQWRLNLFQPLTLDTPLELQGMEVTQ